MAGINKWVKGTDLDVHGKFVSFYVHRMVLIGDFWTFTGKN